MSDKLTIIADSTAIALFDECPMKWNYEVKESLALRSVGINEPLLMGEYGHKLMEILYKTKARGYSLTNSIEAAAAFDPDTAKCECGGDKDHCKCEIFKPVIFPLSKDLRAQVFNRFREYCYTYINNDFIPDSPESVEVGFSEPIFESSDRLYVLEGRIDLIGTFSGLHCAIDHKFQMRMRDLYKRMIQFRNYSMVTKTNMLLINYVRLTKKVDSTTFDRKIASFTPMEHDVWRRRLIGIYDRMAEAILHDSYEQRWSSCSGKFGYECNFTPLCENWDHKLIQIKKDTEFVKKPEWRPW